MTPSGRLVIMGSGETAPTMIKAHRYVLIAEPARKRPGNGKFGLGTDPRDTTRTQVSSDRCCTRVSVA